MVVLLADVTVTNAKKVELKECKRKIDCIELCYCLLNESQSIAVINIFVSYLENWQNLIH